MRKFERIWLDCPAERQSRCNLSEERFRWKVAGDKARSAQPVKQRFAASGSLVAQRLDEGIKEVQ
jgi:hypothetical protein